MAGLINDSHVCLAWQRFMVDETKELKGLMIPTDIMLGNRASRFGCHLLVFG